MEEVHRRRRKKAEERGRGLRRTRRQWREQGSGKGGVIQNGRMGEEESSPEELAWQVQREEALPASQAAGVGQHRGRRRSRCRPRERSVLQATPDTTPGPTPAT